MELKPELVPPLLPAIPVEDLPVADRENGLAFFRNLVMLHYWSFDFSAAVALFELAQSSRSASRFNPADRWPFLAARGGALALRNHMEMFAAGRALIGKISGWRDRINGKELRAIDRCLAERFPKIDKLRHAVAHPEFYADPTIDMTGPAVAEDGIYIAGGGSMQDSCTTVSIAAPSTECMSATNSHARTRLSWRMRPLRYTRPSARPLD